MEYSTDGKQKIIKLDVITLSLQTVLSTLYLQTACFCNPLINLATGIWQRVLVDYSLVINLYRDSFGCRA